MHTAVAMYRISRSFIKHSFYRTVISSHCLHWHAMSCISTCVSPASALKVRGNLCLYWYCKIRTKRASLISACTSAPIWFSSWKWNFHFTCFQNSSHSGCWYHKDYSTDETKTCRWTRCTGINVHKTISCWTSGSKCQRTNAIFSKTTNCRTSNWFMYVCVGGGECRYGLLVYRRVFSNNYLRIPALDFQVTKTPFNY